MSVRQFSLINGQNEVYDLTNHDVFLYDPEGLGFEEATTYQQISDAFVATRILYDQWEPRGTIFFNNPNAYGKYNVFAGFLAHPPLTLVYVVNDIEYRMDVRVHQLRKTQLEIGQELRCDIRFKALSPFYEIKTDYVIGEDDVGKKYSYRYSYRYANSVEDELEIVINGAIPSPVKMVIYGNGTDLVNPTWYHFVNDELIATGRVVATIPGTHTFEISDWTIPYYIAEYNGTTFVRDLYSGSDFTTQRFLFAQPGVNRFRVAHEGLQHLMLTVSVKEYHATV